MTLKIEAITVRNVRRFSNLPAHWRINKIIFNNGCWGYHVYNISEQEAIDWSYTVRWPPEWEGKQHIPNIFACQVYIIMGLWEKTL